MKQILVPTDFSGPAENAMMFAGMLARKTGAGILLLNVFQVPVAMSDVPVLMISAEELKQNADRSLQNAKEMLLKTHPSLSIETESRLGIIADDLDTLAEERSPFAIVIGSHSASGLERFFFGSTSLSVVRHSRTPVIVVPQNSHPKDISRIALALDDQTERVPNEKIRDLVLGLQAELHIIHIQTDHTENKKFSREIPGLRAICNTIQDDEFLHGIQTYLEDKAIDMLMVLPHKHSFVERLTFRTHTEELLRKLTIPVVCINED